jgi:hypothetical protein
MDQIKSFEEFHTSQKRLRAWNEAVQKEREKLTSTEEKRGDGKDVMDDNNVKTFSRRNVGRLLEAYEIQLFVVLLIYLDLVSCTISYVLENDVGTLSSTSKIEKIVDSEDSMILRFLSSISSFTIICFVIEISGLVYSFGIEFFTHFGYCLDMLIISSIVCNNIYEPGIDLIFPLQFLSFFRFWRVARLVSMMVLKVEVEHDNTKLKLNEMERQAKMQNAEYKRLEVSVTKEVGLRKEVEKSLLAYKDEVETLREALKIAAMDVAMTVNGESGNIDTISIENTDIVDNGDGKLIDENGDEFFDGNEEESKK